MYARVSVVRRYLKTIGNPQGSGRFRSESGQRLMPETFCHFFRPASYQLKYQRLGVSGDTVSLFPFTFSNSGLTRPFVSTCGTHMRHEPSSLTERSSVTRLFPYLAIQSPPRSLVPGRREILSEKSKKDSKTALGVSLKKYLKNFWCRRRDSTCRVSENLSASTK